MHHELQVQGLLLMNTFYLEGEYQDADDFVMKTRTMWCNSNSQSVEWLCRESWISLLSCSKSFSLDILLDFGLIFFGPSLD